MHPTPPGDGDHWAYGADGAMHVPGPNATVRCGYSGGTDIIHYRQVTIDDGSRGDWWADTVCPACQREGDS